MRSVTVKAAAFPFRACVRGLLGAAPIAAISSASEYQSYECEKRACYRQQPVTERGQAAEATALRVRPRRAGLDDVDLSAVAEARADADLTHRVLSANSCFARHR